MTTENKALWKAVYETPPSQQKAITGKAYKGNSPKPHYLVEKATEMFGPCGIGWGFEIIEEKLIDGALLSEGFYERVHMARIKVWYKWNGERGEVEHVGQTMFSGKRNNGNTYTDEDAPKKSVTDALVKAMSMIGFSADIFSGRYDDSKYVDGLRDKEEQSSKAPPPDPAKIADGLVVEIGACASLEEMKTLFGQAEFKRAFNSLPDDQKKRVLTEKDRAKPRLESSQTIHA